MNRITLGLRRRDVYVRVDWKTDVGEVDPRVVPGVLQQAEGCGQGLPRPSGGLLHVDLSDLTLVLDYVIDEIMEYLW